MGFLGRVQAGRIELQALGRILAMAPRFRQGAQWNAARMLERGVRRWPDSDAILFEDRRYTWREVDRRVNQTAHAFRSLGVGKDDSVALLMDNRPEFLFAVTALNRIRARAALINTNISGKALTHAVGAGQATRVLVGAEHADQVVAVASELDSVPASGILVQRDGDAAPTADFPVFDDIVDGASDESARGPDLPDNRECMCYIYTSGTTGLPKAAVIKNARYLSAAALFGRGMLDATHEDVVYMTLPLYHSNGMFGGWGSALVSGATLALRRKFSASAFWEDVRHVDATGFVYIGELCRYLLNRPETPEDGVHKLRVICGNGLRPDIWERFQQRFRIPLIREFYGSTEGSGGTVNFAGRPGMVGRLFPGSVVARCEAETGELLRNAEGFCERAQPGETGLLLTGITKITPFDGYVDGAATNKKIVTDAFKQGDRFYNTGDLLMLHEDDWLSFADRVGDTFRWKGENVSTNEVAEILNGAPGVLESNVYGVKVPGAEGRAGMASLNCSEDFSMDRLEGYVRENLPVYMRPYFVRLQRDMRITGTFKHQKTDYRKEGFDPSVVQDPLYFLDGEKYVPLDQALFDDLSAGRVNVR